MLPKPELTALIMGCAAMMGDGMTKCYSRPVRSANRSRQGSVRTDHRRSSVAYLSVGYAERGYRKRSYRSPHDISFQGMGNAYVSIGLGGNPIWRQDFGQEGAFLAGLHDSIRVESSDFMKTLPDTNWKTIPIISFPIVIPMDCSLVPVKRYTPTQVEIR